MPKEDSIPAEGTVVDRLPNALFKVRLEHQEPSAKEPIG